MNNLVKKLWQKSAQRNDIIDEARYEHFAQLIIMECDRYACNTWEHGPLLGGDLKRLFGLIE